MQAFGAMPNMMINVNSNGVNAGGVVNNANPQPNTNSKAISLSQMLDLSPHVPASSNNTTANPVAAMGSAATALVTPLPQPLAVPPVASCASLVTVPPVVPSVTK
jgi:hypothetical protein